MNGMQGAIGDDETLAGLQRVGRMLHHEFHLSVDDLQKGNVLTLIEILLDSCSNLPHKCLTEAGCRVHRNQRLLHLQYFR